MLPLTSLTPLAAHEHGTGRVPRPIIAFPTPQKVVPEDSCALGENELSVCILNTSYKDLLQESRAIHPSAEMPSFSVFGGQGSNGRKFSNAPALPPFSMGTSGDHSPERGWEDSQVDSPWHWGTLARPEPCFNA